MIRAFLPWFGLVLGMLLFACKDKAKTGTPLAKVGESVLTLEDLRRTFPQEFEQALPREQYLDFVKRWIDDEVIYQQAQKAELDKDSAVALRIEDMRRKLLIEEFMARENAGESLEPDEGALSQYYEVHREEFRRKAPEWQVAVLRIKNLKEAIELKPKLRGADYAAQAAPHLAESLPEAPVSLPFIKAQEMRPCMQSAVTATPVGQVAGPLTCPEGVVLVKVLDKAEAGSLVGFADVRDHIAGILMMERKSKQREGTIARYKEGALITFNLDKIPGRDTPLEETEAAPATDAEGLPTVDMAAANPGSLNAASSGSRPRSGSAPRANRPAPPAAAAAPVPSPSENPSAPAAETANPTRGESPAAPATDTVSHESP